MIHKERISFDRGETWHYVADRVRLPLASHGSGLILIIIGAASFYLLNILENIKSGSPAWTFRENQLFYDAVLVIILLLGLALIISGVFLLCKAEAKNSKTRKRYKQLCAEPEWLVEELAILDVQRKDTIRKIARIRANNTGSGRWVGYGFTAKAEDGKLTARTETVIDWQLYTNKGVVLVPDEVYVAWLNAGKPDKAHHAVYRYPQE